LTLTDEKTLWARFKERGDEAARERLILEYMRTVKYIAGRMAIHVPNSVDMDDLIGWGVLGLLDAVDKYDHTQEIKFATYASIRVRGAIIDQIRSLDWAPRSLRAMARKIGGARDQLRHETGREPFSEEIATLLGINEEQVDEVMAQIQTAQVLALDDYLPSEDAGEGRRLDMTGDSKAVSPEEAAIEEEKLALLVSAILQLPEQQQKVLNLYYYEHLTLKEIGAVLEVSESRVCQVHSAAIKALRKVARGDSDAPAH
jgi:RNA polymerase sigma factor FliA